MARRGTLAEIQKLQDDRMERRRLMEKIRTERAEAQKNQVGDVDFVKMISDYRDEIASSRSREDIEGERICIAVRKRPVNAKEISKLDYDSVTCTNPLVIVHDCKLRVDGITKYLDNTTFSFDQTFHEDDTTDDIYKYCVKSLIPFTVSGGRGTVFAYGQTGSGKTYTMVGIQQMAISDLFIALRDLPSAKLVPYVSFFEIYGGRCQDLLNNRNRLAVREDGTGDVVVAGLIEEEARTEEEMIQVIDVGNRNRTTHATESNDESSRSHAICQIVLRQESDSGANAPVFGKLSLIDLAGSERGADTKSHNRQRRLEGAEINKSLLALKECIRALDDGSTHVPYRGSKLTLVLKDSFTRVRARTVMIATVSPAASSADHTLNTLRYADRIKERAVPAEMLEPVANPGAAQPPPPPSSSDAAHPPPASSAGTAGRERRRSVGAPRKGVDRPASTARSSEYSPPTGGGSDRRSKRDSRSSGTSGTDSPARGATPQLYGGAGGGGGAEYSSTRDRDGPDSHLRGSTERERALAEHQAQSNSIGQLGALAVPKRNSLRSSSSSESKPNSKEQISAKAIEDHQNTVEVLFEEEEQLLNMHMAVIQENAELLTEEGRLLQAMQGDSVADEDVDR
jgi:hypothetical protein